ncbi:MAG: hypothetical protein AAF183_24230 [Pseudomonadota bacterium]
METACDAVTLATQTGRLDFLSAILAVLALILGIGAFPVFWYAQVRAEKVAREAAKSAADAELASVRARIEELANQYLDKRIPELFQLYAQIGRETVAEDIANRIAGAQDPDPNEDGN